MLVIPQLKKTDRKCVDLLEKVDKIIAQNSQRLMKNKKYAFDCEIDYLYLENIYLLRDILIAKQNNADWLKVSLSQIESKLKKLIYKS